MDYDIAYLNGVETNDSTVWNCKVLLNDQEVLFKVDTGAKVTVIADDVWKALGQSKLVLPTKKLHGLDNKPLQVKGELSATLSYKGQQCVQPIFVVKHLKHNLLGLPTIQALQVLDHQS